MAAANMLVSRSGTPESLSKSGNMPLTAHNPPAPELLDLADRMGFLVMVEAFDCWRVGKKTRNDYSRLYAQWHVKDLQAIVRRDRNHPSVFMWSIGNEVYEQLASRGGPELAKELRDIVHAEDPTRPVTAGCNSSKAGFNGFQMAVDVFGQNYHIRLYEEILAHPGNEKKPILAAESSSCISSRGEYFFPGKGATVARRNFQISSYDVDKPVWGCTPDVQFASLEKNPAVMGEFVWTGFDYIGEPTPYNKNAPSASSYFGIVDLCGFKKDRFYSYQAHWRPEFPMAHIFPHWNWTERVGRVTPVYVYTSGDEAELFVNGPSAGRQKKEPFTYRLVWDKVVYQPGELKVVAYKDGKEWAKDEVKTTGPAAKLLLSADRAGIRADGMDLSYVTVVVADKDGLMVPRTHNLITFSISGPGDVVAVGNGDAASHEPYQAMQRKAFNGLCLAIVRSKDGEAGKVTLKAESEGLLAAEVVIETR